MGLFDIFKNGNETETVKPVDGNAETEVSKTAGQNSPTEKPRVFIPWPKAGNEISVLDKVDSVAVFIDASFVNSPEFSAFVNGRSGCVNQIYILSSEIIKLAEEAKSILPCIGSYSIPCEDYVSAFKELESSQQIKGAVLFTLNGAAGASALASAKKAGIMLRWYKVNGEGRIEFLSRPEGVPEPQKKAPKEEKRMFTLQTTFTKIAKNANSVSSVPATGARVTNGENSEVYTLQKPVMTDHSSITYATDKPGYFAKIYTPKALQVNFYENKVGRMIKESVKIPGVCWPKATLKTGKGQFVGILVPASRGIQLNHSVLSGFSGIKKVFPNWNKKDVCALAHTILDTVCKLHKLGVLFGCLNPASIYVVSADEVYFVDADTWQIEGYPNMTRNVTFTPPELLADRQKPHLFTMDEENYQVALLTFMLMMPGKYPYAKRKSNSEVDNIKDMSFPFSVGGDMRRSADSERPSGVWQIVWDHLPYKMCNNFYNTFHPNGKFSKPGTRLRDFEWLNAVNEFSKTLMQSENSDSAELVPRTFRRDGKRTFVKCEICGKEHPEFYFLHNIRIQNEKVNVWNMGRRICLPCAVDQSDMSFTCKSCGRTYYYTNRTKLMHEIGRLNFDWNNQKWCHNCKKHTVKCSRCGVDVPVYQVKEFHDKMRNLTKSVCGTCFSELLNEAKDWSEAPYQQVKCRQCGGWFTITNGEAEYFRKKGMNMPSRCPSCRKRRFW